ncbi:MAG TPA: hypothetical protein VM327_01135 [Candidatus Thermoplasmatota archaeon]|nr:hypothetical protein [Candidatus Thermoplasmatota archaeon]
MQQEHILRCPLCHGPVRPRPDARHDDLAPMRRHVARECTVRIA